MRSKKNHQIDGVKVLNPLANCDHAALIFETVLRPPTFLPQDRILRSFRGPNFCYLSSFMLINYEP